MTARFQKLAWYACGVLLCSSGADFVSAQPVDSGLESLEMQLLAEPIERLARDAERFGDVRRGAVLFYQPLLSCRRCHGAANAEAQVGPDLFRLEPKPTMDHVVESILRPSKVIRKAFAPVTVVTDDGLTVTGLLESETTDALRLRDPSRPGELLEIAKASIDERVVGSVSVMPQGLVNQLASRQQFLDLAHYVFEVTQQGVARAQQLEPPETLYRLAPLPEYEERIDHAGLISSVNSQSVRRGQEVYERVCANCHGTVERAGSLPTSLRFASGKFKNGSDPYSMYRTLTHGFGMMVPQRWMVPRQKYDVIHYIREAYLKPHNPTQYARVDSTYLAGLPKGDTDGPDPVKIEPWVTMDYGNQLTATYEIGSDAGNFAYKGIAVRLDAGPGGIARGRHWMIFDHDTCRIAAAWSGSGFIDWNGIMFNGRHAVHPRIVGQIQCQNLTGPGWAEPASGEFHDPRLRGRDDRPYGPLPREWVRYRGQYQYGDRTVIAYDVGATPILESPALLGDGPIPVFGRRFDIGPRTHALSLRVMTLNSDTPVELTQLSSEPTDQWGAGVLLQPNSAETSTESGSRAIAFDGSSWLQVENGDAFDLTGHDFTIEARLKTRQGGTLFCQTLPQPKWVPDGKSLFIRGGRLVFDIGWVGAVQGRTNVADGEWHDVRMTWRKRDGQVELFVDGKLDGRGTLKPKQAHQGQVVRMGFTAADFPRRQSMFEGQLEHVTFYQEHRGKADDEPQLRPLARWQFHELDGSEVRNQSGDKLHATVQRGQSAATAQTRVAMAGVYPALEGVQWSEAGRGELRLKLPAGPEPLRFTLWFAGAESRDAALGGLQAFKAREPLIGLRELIKGGPPRWSQPIETEVQRGSDEGPFAVDVLSPPDDNPWLCRVRLTGFDFLPGGNAAAVCAWDGDVWLVEGLTERSGKLTWKRIASGLFQPLGLKYVDGQIFVTCRDQLVILRDLNGDGETDFYECFNNDHQVTEHFHEFAMGLQIDERGNFYYAKSARHALPALVPHHGTLLRVSPDGQRTEIVANGFRAANGVCLNPDGTFIVTDQEGHWNPKNRINWVREGGFYGNMFGYHDVTDSSDAAMEQPLCWITNSFDRSPSELLWVDSAKWGPLNGKLLNFSYGYGKVYVVPHENLDGQMQGGMCELPLPQFPTGVMRGRFHAGDGQLYCCGMFAWAGTQQQPGGFYRIRATGQPMHLPVELAATSRGMQITFSDPLDAAIAADPENYAVRIWDLKRSANYGSKHYNEQALTIRGIEVSPDRRTVSLDMPGIQPTWCMELLYSLADSDGQTFRGRIHNTVHKLAGESAAAK